MTDHRSATAAVVEFVGSTRFAGLPRDAIEIAKRCVIEGLENIRSTVEVDLADGRTLEAPPRAAPG